MVDAVDGVKAAVTTSEPTKIAASLTAASAQAPAAVRLAETSPVFTKAKAGVAQPAAPTLAAAVVGRLQTRQEYYC